MKFEKIGTNYAKFTFDVTPEVFKAGLDSAFEKIKADVEVKGFRKGHVPKEIYINKFGEQSLYEEALNYAINANYEEIFNEESVVIVGSPQVDVDFEKISSTEPFEVSLTFPIKPEVKLGEYLNAPVEKVDVSVADEEVEEELNNLLLQHQSLEPKTEGALEDGDVAIIDFEGFLEGEPFEGGKSENHQLKIGSGSFIPGFEEQLVGMNPEEEKSIDITFPEEYHSEDLKGKAVVFEVKLHEIKVETQPELDDEFVKSLNKEDIETVEALKEDIRKSIEDYKESNNKNRILGTAVKFAVDNAEVDVPVEMINHERDNIVKQFESDVKNQYGIEFEMYLQLTGMTKEQFEAEMSKEAQNRVLTTLVIEAISEKENFEISEEDIEVKYEEIANMYQMDVNEVKTHLNKEVIEREVRFGKTLELLENNIKEVESEEIED